MKHFFNKQILIFTLTLSISFLNCSYGLIGLFEKSSDSTYSAPLLNAVSAGSITSDSITLNQPTLSDPGNPSPDVNAYIGLNGTISISGNIVSSYIEGPVDVSSSSYQFQSLDSNTTYRIIVVAENLMGYSVEEITHTTDNVNLVQNGSFEDNLDNWTNDDPARFTQTSEDVWDQANSLRYEDYTTDIVHFSQTVNISTGTDYNLSFWGKLPAGSNGNVVFDTSDIFDATCQFTITTGSADNWTYYTCSFNSAGYSTVTIRIFQTAAFSGIFYIDDVRLTE